MTYLPESVEKMEQQVSVLLGVPHGFPTSLQFIIFFLSHYENNLLDELLGSSRYSFLVFPELW